MKRFEFPVFFVCATLMMFSANAESFALKMFGHEYPLSSSDLDGNILKIDGREVHKTRSFQRCHGDEWRDRSRSAMTPLIARSGSGSLALPAQSDNEVWWTMSLREWCSISKREHVCTSGKVRDTAKV